MWYVCEYVYVSGVCSIYAYLCGMYMFVYECDVSLYVGSTVYVV